jgi:hypothetical protein
MMTVIQRMRASTAGRREEREEKRGRESKVEEGGRKGRKEEEKKGAGEWGRKSDGIVGV